MAVARDPLKYCEKLAQIRLTGLESERSELETASHFELAQDALHLIFTFKLIEI